MSAEYTQDQLRRYIKYAKTFKPEIVKDSAAEKLLVANYRRLRETDFAGVGKSVRGRLQFLTRAAGRPRCLVLAAWTTRRRGEGREERSGEQRR